MADCVLPFARPAFRNKFSRFSFLLLFAVSAAVAAPAVAQIPVVVTGLVTDASGGVLPGATVEALRGPRYLVRAVLEGQPGARYPSGPRLVRLLDESSFAAFPGRSSREGASRWVVDPRPGLDSAE